MDHFLQIVIAGNFFLAICCSGQQFCNLSFRTVFLQIVVVNYFSQILQNVVPLIIFCIMFFICEDLGLAWDVKKSGLELNNWLGKGGATKSDEFSEKFRMGGGIFTPKIYVADLWNRAFWAGNNSKG